MTNGQQEICTVHKRAHTLCKVYLKTEFYEINSQQNIKTYQRFHPNTQCLVKPLKINIKNHISIANGLFNFRIHVLYIS